jgi:hypothetical protein
MSKPTTDFEYPTPAVGKIPVFHSVEEEAEFWDTHDFTDFLDESSAVEISVSGDFRERVARRIAERGERDPQAKAS